MINLPHQTKEYAFVSRHHYVISHNANNKHLCIQSNDTEIFTLVFLIVIYVDNKKTL